MNEFTDNYLTNIIENHFKQIEDSLSHNQPERADLWIREAKHYTDYYREHSPNLCKGVLNQKRLIVYQEWYLKLIPYK
jgi:hypothetical protein